LPVSIAIFRALSKSFSGKIGSTPPEKNGPAYGCNKWHLFIAAVLEMLILVVFFSSICILN